MADVKKIVIYLYLYLTKEKKLLLKLFKKNLI